MDHIAGCRTRGDGNPTTMMGQNDAALNGDRCALRIAMIAPPWFELPPQGYGGIEWMCYWLVQGLVDRGHDVTVVGAGNNRTGARFLQTYARPPSDRLGQSVPEIVHAAATSRALANHDFDIVHDHSFAGPLLARARTCPTVVTAHGPVDGDLADYYREIGTAASLVAISRAQRHHGPHLPWLATVHNAIPTDEYPFRRNKEDFALWLGRMSPEKGGHIAIDAAREAGWHLVMAGKCNEPEEKRYFDTEIAPRLGADIEWTGEADTQRKKDLLSRASCLVFPIQWEEPFGIVMVEAMACGTPVVALRRGSVPEVIVHEITGYVCDRAAQLPAFLKRAELIDPQDCRDHATDHFDCSNMVAGYEGVYGELMELKVQSRQAVPDTIVVGHVASK
jgi:glycosyltransferase involved in cell wall biosynthesis